jgi:hypothetical protein
MLPSAQVLKSLGERSGVPVIRERIFRQDYAKTLAIWRNNFRAVAEPEAHRLRRAVPAAVGIRPRLLRGRLSVGKYRRAPGGILQIEIGDRNR